MKKNSIPLTKCIAFFLLLLFSVSACSPKMQPKSETASLYAFDFVDSEQLMPVLAQAKAANKFVFVDFYTTWCLPCRIMEEEVFTDKDLAGFINKHFISYRVDAEKGNGVNLATIFDIKAYPTLLFLDADGQVLVRREGAASQTLFRQLAEQTQEAGE